MEVLERRDYGAATVAISWVGPIAVATLRGPLTARVLSRLCQEWAEIKQPAEASLVDVRGAVVLYSMPELRASTEPLFARGRLKKPSAVVCSPLNDPLFRDWAYRAAHFGILRGAFLDWEPALEWVQERARVLRAEAIYRTAASAI